VFTSHFYGHLDEAQRERVRAVESELVVVDTAFRGVAEDWQERVSTTARGIASTSAGSPPAAWLRNSAAATCSTTARGSWR
jgi:hypothetical protein